MRAAAVQAEGWSVLRLAGWQAPDELEGRVTLYGEISWVEVIAGQVGISLLDVPADWLPNLPERHRGREIQLTTLGRARAWETAAFVKPADGRKGFEGRVYPYGGLGLPDAGAYSDETAVLIADPIHFESEFRCFVLDGEVVAISPYLRAGELAMAADGGWPASERELADARAYAGRVLADVDVPAAVVLDVGLIAGRGWAVVEANSAWGAGVYGCDPGPVLGVLERSCVPGGAITAADRPWLLEAVPAE